MFNVFKKEINGLKQRRSGLETLILEPDPPAKNILYYVSINTTNI
jgi:hypothetical protein